MLAQPETASVIGAGPQSPSLGKLLLGAAIGILLLLPLTIIVITTRLQPALDTVRFSFTDWNAISEPESVENANYERLLQDERFQGAVGYTFVLALYRILAVAIIPPLIGVLAGSQGVFGRALHRIIFALVGALAAPVALSLLWVVFLGMMWGRQPSPLFESFPAPPLASPDSARATVALLDLLITAAIGLAVGGTAFMAVARGRRVRREGAPGLGVWLLMICITLLTAAETFVIPYLTTRGGPANSTNTLGMNMYRDGFQMMSLGLASAEAVMILVAALIVTVLIWLVIVGFRLRLSYTPEEASYGSGGGCIVSFLLLILAALPLVGLVVWGHWLVTNNGGYAQVYEIVNWREALSRTLTVPLQTIWFVQLPITYLAALSLGFVRPLGRRFSDLLFLVLLLLTCIPLEALTFAWFNGAREAGELNTLIPLNLPWLVSGLGLIVLKMFFDGAHEKYAARRASDRLDVEALLRTVLLPALPLAIVIGTVLSFASAQSLFWPLVVTTDPDFYTVPVQLAVMMGQFRADTSQVVGAAVYSIALIAAAAVPVFALLQIFVLDRLAILAGKPDETVGTGQMKANSSEDPLAVIPSTSPVGFSR